MNVRDKLLQILDSEGLTAKQFAERVGIQAGTISNIFSGRNNPSLDVVQKVLRAFPKISPDWFVLDDTNMYRTSNEPVSHKEPTLFDSISESEPKPEPVSESDSISAQAVEHASMPTAEQKPEISTKNIVTDYKPVTTIQKIIVLYSDGTYEER